MEKFDSIVFILQTKVTDPIIKLGLNYNISYIICHQGRY